MSSSVGDADASSAIKCASKKCPGTSVPSPDGLDWFSERTLKFESSSTLVGRAVCRACHEKLIALAPGVIPTKSAPPAAPAAPRTASGAPLRVTPPPNVDATLTAAQATAVAAVAVSTSVKEHSAVKGGVAAVRKESTKSGGGAGSGAGGGAGAGAGAGGGSGGGAGASSKRARGESNPAPAPMSTTVAHTSSDTEKVSLGVRPRRAIRACVDCHGHDTSVWWSPVLSQDDPSEGTFLSYSAANAPTDALLWCDKCHHKLVANEMKMMRMESEGGGGGSKRANSASAVAAAVPTGKVGSSVAALKREGGGAGAAASRRARQLTARGDPLGASATVHYDGSTSESSSSEAAPPPPPPPRPPPTTTTTTKKTKKSAAVVPAPPVAKKSIPVSGRVGGTRPKRTVRACSECLSINTTLWWGFADSEDEGLGFISYTSSTATSTPDRPLRCDMCHDLFVSRKKFAAKFGLEASRELAAARVTSATAAEAKRAVKKAKVRLIEVNDDDDDSDDGAGSLSDAQGGSSGDSSVTEPSSGVPQILQRHAAALGSVSEQPARGSTAGASGCASSALSGRTSMDNPSLPAGAVSAAVTASPHCRASATPQPSPVGARGDGVLHVKSPVVPVVSSTVEEDDFTKKIADGKDGVVAGAGGGGGGKLDDDDKMGGHVSDVVCVQPALPTCVKCGTATSPGWVDTTTKLIYSHNAQKDRGVGVVICIACSKAGAV